MDKLGRLITVHIFKHSDNFQTMGKTKHNEENVQSLHPTFLRFILARSITISIVLMMRFCIYLPVTGSSFIPTHGAKYLETKSYCSPLSSTHPFSFEPFSVRMTPLILPVRSDDTNLSTAGLCASSSAL